MSQEQQPEQSNYRADIREASRFDDLRNALTSECDELRNALAWALDWIEKCAEVPVNMDGEENDWQAYCAARDLAGGE